MKILKLVWTRPVVFPALQGWFEGVGPYLKKQIGAGLTENFGFFQYGVLRSYRTISQLTVIKKFLLCHPKEIIAVLNDAPQLYKKLQGHLARLAKSSYRTLPKILADFYSDYLASWLANFPAFWISQLTTQREWGNEGKKIFNLSIKARQAIDPFVFAAGFYLALIKKIEREKKLLQLCRHDEILLYLRGNLSQEAKHKILLRNEGCLITPYGILPFRTLDQATPYLKRRGYFIQRDDRVTRGVRELRGVIATKGRVRGSVKLLFSYTDNKKVKKRDIIVSPMTTPAFTPAIQRCSAMITDEGGVTCHAAIVSRELGIPCIVGTKIATKVFKDGDMVEVDANKGIVRRLSRW